MRITKEIIVILVVIASVLFAGWVVNGSAYMAGESAGFKSGESEGFKKGRVYQATVTPVIVKQEPITVQSLDKLNTYDIYDYLKARVEQEQKRRDGAEGKVF